MELPERWICDGKPSERFPIYTRGNVGEVFPWPVTPATWSLGVIQASEPGWRDSFARFGAFEVSEFSPTDTEIIGCFGGYCYLNASVSRVLGVRTPGLTPEQIDYSFWGEMPGVPPYQPMDGDESPARTEAIQNTLNWVFSAPRLTELEDDQAKMAELRAARPDFGAMSDAEIVAWYRSLIPELRRLFAEHLFITYCSSVPLGVIQGICTAIGQPTLAMTLVSGIGDVDSAAPSYAFWKMGRQVRGSATLTAAFDGGVSGLETRLRASDDPDAVAFCAAFDEFLYEFGSRGPNEWETSAASWETDPELPLAAIDRMRLVDDADAPRRPPGRDGRRPRGGHPRSARSGGRRSRGPRPAGGRAGGGADLPRRPGAHQDQHHPPRQRAPHRAARELGRRMVERGFWAKPTSGAMLEDSEIEPFLADPEAWVDTIREREAQYELLFDLEPPFVFAGSVPPLRTWEQPRPPHRPRVAGHGPDRHPRLSRHGHRPGPRRPRPGRPRQPRARRRARRARSPTPRGRRCSCPPARSSSTSAPSSATP